MDQQQLGLERAGPPIERLLDTVGTGGGNPSAGSVLSSRHSLGVYFYVGAVALAGLAMLATTFVVAPTIDLPTILILCAAGAASELMRVKIANDSVGISLSLAVIMAAVVAAGPFGAALCAVSAAIAIGFMGRPRPKLQKTIFNVGVYAVGAGAAGLTYHLLGGGVGRHEVSAVDAIACGGALLANIAVNWPAIMIIIRLTTGRPLREIWEDFRWMPVQVAVSAAIGFTLGASYVLFGWAGAAVYVAPLVAMREAMRQYTNRVAKQMHELWVAHAAADEANRRLVAANSELDSTNEGLLKTLAAVIDARDIYLYGHSVQASKYAGKVARKLGLTEQQVRVTELGALLHDLGKIGISEAILNKPARLTDDEYEEIKTHCDIGYQLLSNLPHFEEVAEVVWSHHEEYDGTGYPRRIGGEEIHIGARIVSVVEATEAMVSDRPYRKGMSPDEVLRELAAGAGSQWDPQVVEAFSGILSADRKHLVMRNSALELELSRTPVASLVRGAEPQAPADKDAAMNIGEVQVLAALRRVTETFISAADPIFVLDDGLRIVAMNPSAERSTGWREVEIQGRSWADMLVEAEPLLGTPSAFFSAPRPIRMKRADANDVGMELLGGRINSNGAGYWLVLAQGAGRAQFANAAPGSVDPLTGLATRPVLEHRALQAMRKRVWPLTILVLDIDGLGAINQTFGHDTGDAALSAVGQVLASQLRGGDMAARIAGDRFAVLMCSATMQDATRVVERLEEGLPVAAAGLDCVIELCSGVAEWNGKEDFTEFVARADVWLAAERRSRRPALAQPMAMAIAHEA
jgi:diguanylate cyclase (GGDEF)-like protein/putative nucleotidyltransferase with HDIG domain